MNRTVLALIEAEFRRYRILGERAFSQLEGGQLVDGSQHASSIATIVWHVAGNLESRFPQCARGTLALPGARSLSRWADRVSGQVVPRAGLGVS